MTDIAVLTMYLTHPKMDLNPLGNR